VSVTRACLSDAIAIAAGGYHSLALRANQRIVAWGANSYGESSPPSTITNAIGMAAAPGIASPCSPTEPSSAGATIAPARSTCLPISRTSSPLPPVATQASPAGQRHGSRLGENTDSQEPTSDSRSSLPVSLTWSPSPRRLPQPAVRADGTVVAWGDNSSGQAQPPAGLTGVAVVAGGGVHSLALRVDGTIAAWGGNWKRPMQPSARTRLRRRHRGRQRSFPCSPGQRRGPWQRLTHPVRQGNQFQCSFKLSSGKITRWNIKNSLTDPNWTSLPPVPGNGAMQFLVDPAATVSARSYRVRACRGA